VTRGIPYLIHELVKRCFENKLTLSIQSISDEKGENIIERTDTYIKITIYESNENDVNFAKELDILVDNLKTTP
jgi:hypothetical protein